MKRKIILCLSFVLLLLVLSACGCEHEWADATCIAPQTCEICGKTEGELAEHKWEPATCTKPKTCMECGETEGNLAEHIWEKATVKKPKTCYVCKTTEGTALPVKYFEMSMSKYNDAFNSKVVSGLNVAGDSSWGIPFYDKNNNPLVLFIEQEDRYNTGEEGEWNLLRVRIVDAYSIEYDYDISEMALNILTKCAQILDSSFADDEIDSIFFSESDAVKTEWSDDYNTFQLWYSKNGYDYYIYDHVKNVGSIGNSKPAAYWYEFTIKLTENG